MRAGSRASMPSPWRPTRLASTGVVLACLMSMVGCGSTVQVSSGGLAGGSAAAAPDGLAAPATSDSTPAVDGGTAPVATGPAATGTDTPSLADTAGRPPVADLAAGRPVAR